MAHVLLDRFLKFMQEWLNLGKSQVIVRLVKRYSHSAANTKMQKRIVDHQADLAVRELIQCEELSFALRLKLDLPSFSDTETSSVKRRPGRTSCILRTYSQRAFVAFETVS